MSLIGRLPEEEKTVPEITTITRPNVRILNDAVRRALASIEAEYGVSVEVGGGRFDPHAGTFNPKVTIKVAGADANNFAAMASLYGLEASDHGRKFTSHGRTFRIESINPRASTMPIHCVEVSTGRGFKFSERTVKQALLSSEAPRLSEVDRGELGLGSSHPSNGVTEYALLHNGAVVKTSKSRASLLSFKSRQGLTGATIVEVN